jgi:predicted ABC-type ATPase
MKDIVLLGGPNGARKTTAARVLVPLYFRSCEFVNADEFARTAKAGSAAARDIAAGRLMIARIHELIQAEESLVFETTCAGKSYVPMLERCRLQGWRVTLIYLWLASPGISEARVARRVREGGHDIPREAIYRRYRLGLWNMRHLYLPLADDAAIYDNDDDAMTLIAEKESGQLTIRDAERWSRIGEQILWK